MRPLTFTRYSSKKANRGTPQTFGWDEWVRRFSVHEVRGTPAATDNLAALNKAKNGPAIVLGLIPEGQTRANAHVQEVHALSLDIEGHSDEVIAAALGHLVLYEYFVWTTHKHGSEVAGGYARLRVVLPLQEPLTREEHAEAWARLNALCGKINDPSTKDPSRLNFLPSTFDPSKAWTLRHPGQWLDAAQLPPLPEFERADSPSLGRLRRQLKVLRNTHDLKPAMTALLKGEAFAAAGERHNTILGLTMEIAERSSTVTPEALLALFGPSLDAMSRLSPDAPSIEDVIAAYDGAVDKLREWRREDEREAQREAAQIQVQRVNASAPYSAEDLQRIAKANGWEVEDLRTRWIIQRDGCAWFLLETGDYAGPYTRDDLALALSKFLARAPVRLVDITRTGARYRNLVEVARESGSLADGIISDLTIQRTRFDPDTRIMHEAIRPIRRDLTPAFDEGIDEWIRILGGTFYPKLVDWMSCAPDLNKLLCALYFDGAPGSGKTLFGHGMAKLWAKGPPADIEAVLSDFNEELCRCPLVIADEEIPKRWRSTVTTTLRSMLSTMSRTLKRKYRPTSEVRGALRLVLTANNEFLLDSHDVSSSQDLEAIAQRFLYIHVPQAAADYLKEEVERPEKERWGDRGIAEHALWLAQNHVIERPGKRFWVEGNVSQMHRLLMTGSRWNSMVCEWLVRYLMTPSLLPGESKGLIRAEGGELFVNDQVIIDGWDLYLRTKQEPETSKIGAALRAISLGPRKQLRHEGKLVRFRPIDIGHLLSWSDRYNIGDRATMLEAIGAQHDGQPAWVGQEDTWTSSTDPHGTTDTPTNGYAAYAQEPSES